MATPEPMPRGEAPLLAEFMPRADFTPPANTDIEGASHLRLVQDHQLPFGQPVETVIDSHKRQVVFHRSQLEEGFGPGNPMLGIHTEQFLIHSTLYGLAVARDIEGYNRQQAEIHRRHLAQQALAGEGE